jgi:NAD(P)-dependent dehydrogenase (short-subunit alcohol dehydrogenase family)
VKLLSIESKPKANIVVIELDLSSLSSIRQFAKEVSERESRIDILINNAGVMMCPEWKTEDGFEMQFGTNHLGIYENSLSVFQ